MSVFLTKELVDKAIAEIFDEMSEFTLRYQKKGFHVVVLDPAVPYQPIHYQSTTIVPPNYILSERSCNEDKWAGSDYKAVARGKAQLCLREKMNSGAVPRHMLRSGDVKWRGGVYYNGIVVAVSGFDSADDEAFSLKIAHRCEQLAEEEYYSWHDANPRQSFV